MLKEKIEQIKSLILKGDNNKKKIENLVVFIVILIITIIVINMIWNDNKQKSEVNNIEGAILSDLAEETTKTSSNTLANNELERRLENILSKIEGVGDVKVMVTYSETSQTIAMYNEDNAQSDTEESDTQGGTRKVTESTTKKEVIYKEVDGEKIPVTQSIISPKAEGAIIAANGASNAEVKTNIIQAVEAVTGLATHKIQVFEMKK